MSVWEFIQIHDLSAFSRALAPGIDLLSRAGLSDSDKEMLIKLG